MNKHAIISTDSNPSYLFLTPITCLCWKKIGYNPIVLLVEDDKETVNLIQEYSDVFGYNIKKIKKVEGYRSCNIAQISRLFASTDSGFSDDDYLITSDMDMLPISSLWFNQQDWTKNIHIYDAEELNYKRHKICYIGMNKKKWIKVFDLKEETCIDKQINKFLNSRLPRNCDWDSGWNLDELYLYECLNRDEDYPKNCHMIERGMNQYGLRNGRIDRGIWKNTLMQYVSSRTIDVHLPRNSYKDEIWKDIKIIMSLIFSKEEIDFFEEYKRKFVNITLGENNEKSSF